MSYKISRYARNDILYKLPNMSNIKNKAPLLRRGVGERLKLAVLSPVAWRTPPRHYGPWEQIASNIAEGMTRDGDKEKRYFLSMAKGSCSELRTQIYIGVEVGFISAEIGRDWIERCKRIAAMLSGLLKRLQRP